MKTLPAGTMWEQTRGNEWLVTIRREPETVYEPRDYQNAFADMAAAHRQTFGYQASCSCCGHPLQGQFNGGALNGLIGGIFG